MATVVERTAPSFETAPGVAEPTPTVVLPKASPTVVGGGRRTARKVLAIITLGLVVGAAIGYGTYSITRDELDRGQIADAARWQGQANAYLKYQAALARGRAADAARLQAQANAYLSGERGLTRGQLADAARLQAQGDAFISR